MWRTKHLILAALIMLLPCCAANQNSQMGRSGHLEANKAFNPDRVSFADGIGVLVTDIKTAREGQFLKVQVELMNAERADTTIPVYQIEWLDKDGFVKEQSSWKPLKIVGNQKVKFMEMSTVPNIADYKLTIAKEEN